MIKNHQLAQLEGPVLWRVCLNLPSGPPSGPENPISTVNETCVTLEWSPPRDTGGRGDITYSLHCRKCSDDGRKCVPCGSSVHFVPRQYGLSSAVVLVTDLQPDSNYSFTVESQNGVSDLSPSPRGKVVINVTTSQTGESIWQTRTHTHTNRHTHAAEHSFWKCIFI